MSNFTRMLLGLTCALVVAACGGAPAAPTPNIDATVEAGVAATRVAEDVQRRIRATMEPPTPTHTAAPEATANPEPTLTPTRRLTPAPNPYSYFKKGTDYLLNDEKYQLAIDEYTTAIRLDPSYKKRLLYAWCCLRQPGPKLEGHRGI